MATLTNSQQGSAGAAATGTILLTFAQTAARLLEMLVRGSANASATIANIFDNAGGAFTSTGTNTTTTMQASGVTWTTNQWAGYMVTVTNAADPDFNLSRLISSNTSNTLTFAAYGSAPINSGTFVIGNVWAAVAGQSWTADGGVGTSHAQWWHASNILAASTSATTVTVVWGGGNTANTLTVLEFGGYDTTTPDSSTTAASGTGTTPTCNSLTVSGSGYLVAGFSTPTTAQTWSSALDNAAGSTMTITQPAGTSRAATPTLVKASGGTFAPRITDSTSEGWVAIPLFINDPAGAVVVQPYTRWQTIMAAIANADPVG